MVVRVRRPGAGLGAWPSTKETGENWSGFNAGHGPCEFVDPQILYCLGTKTHACVKLHKFCSQMNFKTHRHSLTQQE